MSKASRPPTPSNFIRSQEPEPGAGAWLISGPASSIFDWDPLLFRTATPPHPFPLPVAKSWMGSADHAAVCRVQDAATSDTTRSRTSSSRHRKRAYTHREEKASLLLTRPDSDGLSASCRPRPPPQWERLGTRSMGLRSRLLSSASRS